VTGPRATGTIIAAAEASRWIAGLPVRRTEQPGRSCLFSNDVMIGEAYLARVRELLPRAACHLSLPLQNGRHLPTISIPGKLTAF